MPEVGFGLTEASREYVHAWRLLEARDAGLVFGLDVEGRRRESTVDETEPEHRVGLGLGWELVGARREDLKLRLEASRLLPANDNPESRMGVRLTAPVVGGDARGAAAAGAPGTLPGGSSRRCRARSLLSRARCRSVILLVPRRHAGNHAGRIDGPHQMLAAVLPGWLPWKCPEVSGGYKKAVPVGYLAKIIQCGLK